jgi:integrase/recombinase XerD
VNPAPNRWTIRRSPFIGEQNVVFCSLSISRVNRRRSQYFSAGLLVPFMSGSLFDRDGCRKYLLPSERFAFVTAAMEEQEPVVSFCLTMAFTGARISEALALTAPRIDRGDETIVFRTLKQRGSLRFRAVPVPGSLLVALNPVCAAAQIDGRLWMFGRTTAWKIVKSVLRKAEIAEGLCKPKALRHAFAVEAVLNGVPLNMLQKWMGHARLETTAIYANVLGEEERTLARRTWSSLEGAVCQAS